MSDSVKEQLSACLDGELAEAELDLLLKRIGRSQELCDAIGRYALLSEALKGDTPVATSRAFAQRVIAALENEPVSARSQPRLSPAVIRRLRPVAGFAVAAGVATVAVLSMQQARLDPPVVAGNETITAPEATLAVADEQPSYTVPTTTSASAFVPATRLTNYVVAHSEYSSPLGRRTVLSGVLSDDDATPYAPAEPAPELETQVTHP